MGDLRFVRRFGEVERPGAYLRIIGEGTVAAGDEISLVSRPEHQVSVRLVARAVLGIHDLAPRLLAASALPDALQRWAREWQSL